MADGALVGAEQPPLEQRRHAVNVGQQILAHLWRVARYRVVVATGRQPGITAQSVGNDIAALPRGPSPQGLQPWKCA